MADLIQKVIRMNINVVMPKNGGYEVYNAQHPESTIWLSGAEWRYLCKIKGWMQ